MIGGAPSTIAAGALSTFGDRGDPAHGDRAHGDRGHGDRAHGAQIPAPGTRFDRFEVIRQLGAGAMGVVMLARDLDLDRHVAIKFLTPRAAAGEDANQRLLREAQAVARLQHPNVVAVHEVGRLGTGVYVVMEYVDGGTLRQWCAATPRSWSQIVDVYVQAAMGLEAAHRLGLVHRDFKPDNALIGRDGRVRVSDFGLVAATPGGVAEGVDPSAPSDDVTLTRTGAVLGTPAYMAPEQFAGGTVGPAADQFAFCVSLFEALYGSRPFGGANAFEILGAIESGTIRALARIDVPASIHGAIMRGLAKDPALRHPTLAALAAILGGHATAVRTSAAPKVPVAAIAATAAVLVAGIVGTAWWMWPREPDPPPVETPAVVRSTACDIEAVLATVWSTSRRTALLEAGHEPVALAAIDRRVDALAAGARTTCASPPADAVLAERMAACLHVEVDTTAGLVDALDQSPGPLLRARAASVVDSLFAPTICTDEAQLVRRGRISWSPATRELRRASWRAHASAFTGEAERAATILAELAPGVAAAGDPGLAMVLASGQARSAMQRGDLAAAEGGLRETLAYARELQDGAYETIALTDLLDIDLRLGRAPTDVEARITALRAAIERSTPDVAWYGRAAIARVAANAGRALEAQTELDGALSVLESATWPRQTQVARLLLDRAALRTAAGRRAEARADVERAVSELESALGRDSVAFAEQAIVIAGRRLGLGELDDASAMIDGAAARLRDAPPSIRQTLGDALYVLARAELEDEDLVTAARRIGEALAVAASTGAEEREAAYALLQAEIELGRGHPTTAGDAVGRAGAIAERHPRSTVIDRAQLAWVRGTVALFAGDLAAASRAMAERLAILEATGGAITLPVAVASVTVGTLAVAQSDCETAARAFEKSRRIRERLGAAVDESHVEMIAGEAICHARSKEEVPARALLRALSAIEPAVVEQRVVKPAIAMVEAELALAAGELAQAKAQASVARDGYRAMGTEGEPWARMIEGWMHDNLVETDDDDEDADEDVEAVLDAELPAAGH
jgi:tetratricopeptide (TPR) repeat protein